MASGVTIEPFFTTKSAFMTSSVFVLAQSRDRALNLIGVEHALDVVGIRGLGERERKKNARLPGLQIVAGDETLTLQARASNHAAGGNPAAQAHQHAVLLVGFVKGSILGRRRPARAGRGADDALGPGSRGGLDHDAIGVDVGENDIDTRE